MGVNIYYLELIFILVSVFQQQKLMKKDILTEILFLRKKDKKHQKKKLGCKFIRINTSNSKNGYDLDYEVGNVQVFIDEFKNKKIKKFEKQLIKEKEMREKLEERKRNKSRKQKVENRMQKVECRMQKVESRKQKKN